VLTKKNVPGDDGLYLQNGTRRKRTFHPIAGHALWFLRQLRCISSRVGRTLKQNDLLKLILNNKNKPKPTTITTTIITKTKTTQTKIASTVSTLDAFSTRTSREREAVLRRIKVLLSSRVLTSRISTKEKNGTLILFQGMRRKE